MEDPSLLDSSTEEDLSSTESGGSEDEAAKSYYEPAGSESTIGSRVHTRQMTNKMRQLGSSLRRSHGPDASTASDTLKLDDSDFADSPPSSVPRDSGSSPDESLFRPSSGAQQPKSRAKDAKRHGKSQKPAKRKKSDQSPTREDGEEGSQDLKDQDETKHTASSDSPPLIREAEIWTGDCASHSFHRFRAFHHCEQASPVYKECFCAMYGLGVSAPPSCKDELLIDCSMDTREGGALAPSAAGCEAPVYPRRLEGGDRATDREGKTCDALALTDARSLQDGLSPEGAFFDFMSASEGQKGVATRKDELPPLIDEKNLLSALWSKYSVTRCDGSFPDRGDWLSAGASRGRGDSTVSAFNACLERSFMHVGVVRQSQVPTSDLDERSVYLHLQYYLEDCAPFYDVLESPREASTARRRTTRFIVQSAHSHLQSAGSHLSKACKSSSGPRRVQAAARRSKSARGVGEGEESEEELSETEDEELSETKDDSSHLGNRGPRGPSKPKSARSSVQKGDESCVGSRIVKAASVEEENMEEVTNEDDFEQPSTEVGESKADAEVLEAKHINKKFKMQGEALDSEAPQLSAHQEVKSDSQNFRVLSNVLKMTPQKIDFSFPPRLPLQFGAIILLNLGQVVYDREKFHSKRYIFPVGYRSKRLYFSLVEPTRRCWYIQEILEGRPSGGAHSSPGEDPSDDVSTHYLSQEPLFRLTCEDLPSEPIEGSTPSGVWSEVLERIRPIREGIAGRKLLSTVSGPEQFGLSHRVIHQLIERLPNASLCVNYDPAQVLQAVQKEADGRKKRAKGGESQEEEREST
ncbi:uncharacterized protein LOC126326044 [Schistocerca gregaria]|uniref:uncharacterized protein LOC126326044 n=1 Tax=Schistocerca gregaria TaxID=7010 RepID=UPI00211EB30E|nr:uncharacterized protein LOC126326044 [Schistocerca gregaria]